ncbi:MAG: hypothetical protein ACRDFZ_03260 [Candidatus Limnocylindria bacterium]
MIGRWLVRLYPTAWRARFGEEFLDLLESRPLTLRAVADVLRGAIDAHLDPQLVGGPLLTPRLPTSTRLLGVAAMGSGGYVILGILFSMGVSYSPTVVGYTTPFAETAWTEPFGSFRLAMFAPLALAGMIGVHRRHVARAPALAWSGLAPAVIFAGLASPNILPDGTGLMTFHTGQAGFILNAGFWVSVTAFGVVAAVIGVAPRSGTLSLAVGAPMAMIGMFGPTEFWFLVAAAGVVLFGFGLVWLGIDLVLRREEPRLSAARTLGGR